MLTDSAVRKVATRLGRAADRTVEALREGRIEQEPAITDRMLGCMEETLRGFTAKGIRWSAKTLTDHGPGTQEPKYGADFMGVLDIRLPGFTIAKGFLAQAKLLRPGRRIDATDLKVQCERMLDHSSHSFVFLYSQEQVRVIPAVSVIGSGGNLDSLHSSSVQRFFEDHLRCFIGDKDIRTPTPATLGKLAERLEVKRAILIQAREVGSESES